MVLQAARVGGATSGSIREGSREHTGGACWHREKQLLRGKHAWPDGRQIFPLQGNGLKAGFPRAKLKHRPWREEKRQKVAETALEQKTGASPAAGDR